MRKLSTLTATGILAFGLAGTAFAQAPAPGGAAPDPHHPEAPAGSPPAQRAAPATGMMGPDGGMMGGDMSRMMQMMTQMQGGMGPGAGPNRMDFAMRPFRRIEGQLAYFRTELRITDAQMPQWNSFADAVRTQSERLRQVVMQAMQSAGQPATAPQQIERRVALLSAHVEAMRAVGAAAGPLYAALSEEQRRTADDLMAEHVRSMRMGMF